MLRHFSSNSESICNYQTERSNTLKVNNLSLFVFIIFNPLRINLQLQKQMEKKYYNHETAIIDEGCTIGEGTKIWHFSHIMKGCTLGEKCNIGQNVVVSPDVVLGNNVKVQNNVSIYTGVTCDDDVFLGPSMVFTNVINPRSAVNRKNEYMKTHVGKGATIGANATIVCGHDIGAFAFIGAGAVVTKEILPYALVVGNPAKQLGWMSEYGQRLNFDKNGIAICSESGEKYQLSNEKVLKIS
jgi:UDP-2-acetamido-3-amino-2,3-dideoxy-glucuronate N-acetyltransferase